MYLEPGDVVFFYTDGITEAMDEDGVEFGDGELATLLSEVAGSSAATFNRRAVEAVQDHAGEADQSDDITCLSLRYLE